MKSEATSPQQLSGWNAYKRLMRYVGNYWPLFVVSILGFGLYGASQAAFAALMQFLPDAFNDVPSGSGERSLLADYLGLDSPQDYRIFLPIAVVALALVRGVGSYLGGYYIQLIARNVVNGLRQELFTHMQKLPGWFYSLNSSGHLISIITFNVEQVTAAATEAVKVIIREGITVIALLTYLFYLNWRLSLVFLLIGPVIAFVVGLASRFFRRYSRRIQDSMGDVTHVASEAIKGFKVVKAFGGSNYEKERFARASEYNLKQSLKLARTNEISTPVVQFLVFSAMALLFWFGLEPSVNGGMTTGEFLAYITAASLIAKPMRQLTSVDAKIQRGIAAAQSVFATIDAEKERDEGTLLLARSQGRIEFREVDFRYVGGSEAAIQDIDLLIEPGETLALVGRSGSGKSTLVNLLPRFYDLSAGAILLDGRPLQEYRLADLRRQIAVVSQQIVLFKDTVARNIAYGELAGASMDAIHAAARAAHAIEFIEALPQGMDTPIGEDGINLSGGQRQRLAIARAILKDAPILILDEATSALDSESERYIQDALHSVMRGRTTLVIAHRLSTIEQADKIVVMDKGRIVEVGRHAELLAKDGAYAQLHRMQFADS